MYSDEQDERGRASVREKERAGLHPTRVAILEVLSGPGKRELPATALCHELPGSPALSQVAYHLEVLLEVGLVQADENDPAAPVYFLPISAASANPGE
jgi:DNA-binding transcriptional ArsR family regulator